METITVRCENIKVIPVDDELIDVELRNVDLQTLVNDFPMEKILECLEFSQVFDWAVKTHNENE